MKIDGAFCISLDDPCGRKRLRSVVKRFEAFDIDVGWLKGVDSRKGPRPPNALPGAPGGWGVTLSHKKAMRTGLERGWKHVLILEDDAVPTDKFPEAWGDVLSYDGDFATLHLGYWGRMRFFRRRADRIWQARGDFYGAHAYVMNLDHAQSYLDFMGGVPWDDYMGFMANRLECLVTRPAVVYQAPGVSQVFMGYTNRRDSRQYVR